MVPSDPISSLPALLTTGMHGTEHCDRKRRTGCWRVRGVCSFAYRPKDTWPKEPPFHMDFLARASNQPIVIKG